MAESSGIVDFEDRAAHDRGCSNDYDRADPDAPIRQVSHAKVVEIPLAASYFPLCECP